MLGSTQKVDRCDPRLAYVEIAGLLSDPPQHIGVVVDGERIGRILLGGEVVVVANEPARRGVIWRLLVPHIRASDDVSQAAKVSIPPSLGRNQVPFSDSKRFS